MNRAEVFRFSNRCVRIGILGEITRDDVFVSNDIIKYTSTIKYHTTILERAACCCRGPGRMGWNIDVACITLPIARGPSAGDNVIHNITKITFVAEETTG